MVRGYFPQSGHDALAELLVGLAGVPAVAVLVPPRDTVGMALLDLRPRQSLPAADVDLAELAERDDIGVEDSGNDFRRLAGAQKVARVRPRCPRRLAGRQARAPARGPP